MTNTNGNLTAAHIEQLRIIENSLFSKTQRDPKLIEDLIKWGYVKRNLDGSLSLTPLGQASIPGAWPAQPDRRTDD